MHTQHTSLYILVFFYFLQRHFFTSFDTIFFGLNYRIFVLLYYKLDKIDFFVIILYPVNTLFY